MKKILCALLGLILTLPGFAACPSGQVEQTYNWNQLWNAENISNLGGNLNVADNNDGSFDLTVQQNAQYNSTQMRTNGSFIIGHKYVFAMDLTLLNDNNLANHSTQFRQCNGTGATFGAINVNFSATNETIHQMGLPFTATNAMSYMCFVIVTQFSYPEIDTSVRINNIQLYDLTAMFGAGNEPTTPEEAEQAISNRAQLLGIDRYVYNSGSQITACITPIKIATTAYNSARFSPVVTELNDTIATIRSVVTNTINQTKAIADLQATKQTRPDETCPAGKKCLLVEDNDGTPHWYEIIESAYGLPDGYIERQYIYMMDGSYIRVEDLPISAGYRVEFDFQTLTLSSPLRNYIGGRARGVSAGGGFRLSKLASSNNSRVVLYGFDSGTEYYDPTAQFQANTRYKYTYNNGVCTLESGGSVVSTQTFTVTDDTSTNWGINTYTNGTTWQTDSDGIYVYSLKVWNAQGELVMDLIPAENSSGVVGMYDTVSGTFKTATAGTFTAGPEI